MAGEGFPTSPNDGDEYTTALGTVYKYLATDDKWYIISGDLEHNSLSGLNDGIDYEHITQTQKDALHTIYSLEVHDNDEHDPDYEVANANIQSHVASPVTDAHHVKYTDSEAQTQAQAVSINNLSEDGSPQLGADLDLNGKSINCNGNLGSNLTFEGLTIDNITNAQAFGKFVIITSAHTTALCDKDSIALSIGVSVGTGEVLYSGTIRDDSWSLTVGDPVYIGDSGDPTDDISGYTTGDMVQCVGVAIDTNMILVKDICWVEVI